ncbi:hypothetical protein IG631_17494 [Alternaria alternata]|nr:hypothetical protein IG631_17494 [Alternaria alternata]
MSSKTSERSYLPSLGVTNHNSAFLPLNPDLREIRCIILLPGSGEDPIACELVYTRESMDDPLIMPDYTKSLADVVDDLVRWKPSLSKARSLLHVEGKRNDHSHDRLLPSIENNE